MVSKSYLIILTLVVVFIGQNLSAQILPGQVISTDIKEEAAKYELYYEVVLNNGLADYYQKGTFIIDAKVTLERVLVPKEYEVVEEEKPVKIRRLPGLPFVPPNLQGESENTSDSLKAVAFDEQFQLTRLYIKVLVDTSYNDEDVEFVEEATYLIVDADPFRGDIVSVEKKVFPRNARAIEQEVTSSLKSSENELTEDQNEEDTLEDISDSEKEENVFLGIDWNNPTHLLYLLGILGAAFVITFLYALFRKPKSKEELSYQKNVGYDNLNSKLPLLSSNDENKGPDVKTLAKYEEDKTYITNNCISHPDAIAKLLGQWIASDDEQGVIRSAKAISSVDEKLIKVLEPHMKVETYETVKFTINNSEPSTIEDKIEDAKAFRKSIQQVNIQNKVSDSGSNLFDFVYQLTDLQLQHLIKEESDELAAILLAQIAGEKAGTILQKLDEQKRISILLKMGKINNIPVSVYKKVAAHFSNKALTISDMKYVAADGIDSILATIETLPLNEQDDYVRSIAEKDLNLAKRIKKFFIGFDDLPKIKDELLQNALEGIETDVIILALKTAPATVREKVLRIRPKREQRLILSEIDNPSKMSMNVIEDAQKTLLYAVRRKMKTEG
jgi:flagellar motor switch protein FliG